MSNGGLFPQTLRLNKNGNFAGGRERYKVWMQTRFLKMWDYISFRII